MLHQFGDTVPSFLARISIGLEAVETKTTPTRFQQGCKHRNEQLFTCIVTQCFCLITRFLVFLQVEDDVGKEPNALIALVQVLSLCVCCNYCNQMILFHYTLVVLIHIRS